MRIDTIPHRRSRGRVLVLLCCRLNQWLGILHHRIGVHLPNDDKGKGSLEFRVVVLISACSEKAKAIRHRHEDMGTGQRPDSHNGQGTGQRYDVLVGKPIDIDSCPSVHRQGWPDIEAGMWAISPPNACCLW